MKHQPDYHLNDILETLLQADLHDVSLEELVDLVTALQKSSNNVKRLHDISTRRFTDAGDMLQAYLTAGCEILAMEVGVVSRIKRDNTQYSVQAVYPPDKYVSSGAVFSVGDTYCRRVVSSRETVCCEKTGATPIYPNLELEAYIGTPIIVGNEIYGTLAFAAALPREAKFQDTDVEFIEMIAWNIGRAIETDQIKHQHSPVKQQTSHEEIFYHLFIKHSPMAVAMFDTEMRYLAASDQWFVQYGLEDRDIIGKSHYDIFPESHDWKTVHQRCLEGAIEKSDGDPFPRTDGSVDWVRWEVQPWYADETIGGIVMLTEVITERKEAQLRLERSEALYRVLIEHLPDMAVAVFDNDLRFTVADGPILRSVGYDIEGVLGKTAYEVLPPERQADMIPMYKKVLQGETFQFDIEHEGKTYDFRCVPMYDLNSTIIGGMIAIQDVSRQKMIEQALSRSENWLKMTLQATRAGTWKWNILSGTITLNERAVGIIGYTLDELASTNYETWREFIHPDDLTRSDTLLKQHLAAESEFYDCEVRMKHKDGRWVWVWERGTVMEWTEDGRPLRMFGTYLDITKRKQAELEMQELNLHLEQANAEVQQFAYIVSHDLRSPLINLQGFTTVLDTCLQQMVELGKEFASELTGEQRGQWNKLTEQRIPTALHFIQNAVERMDSYTSAILTLSRLGRHQLNYAMISVDQLVSQIKQAFSSQIQAQNIQFQIEDLPDVRADRLALDQILTNIITNAVKYLDPGRPGWIRIYAEDDALQSTIHVQDNGRGIAEADFDKVFAPFRRAGRPTVEGEGMGLAYVQTLVKRLGGSIWFDSTLDEGSTFSFTLPKGNAHEHGATHNHSAGGG
ncbi:MAG: PAS domain S-box protein [Chloroflexi bacterium]|nr:PAS domain S-box protein [Chloroflexota bacterium]